MCEWCVIWGYPILFCAYKIPRVSEQPGARYALNRHYLIRKRIPVLVWVPGEGADLSDPAGYNRDYRF